MNFCPIYEIGRDAKYTDETQYNPCPQRSSVSPTASEGQGRLPKEEIFELVLEGYLRHYKGSMKMQRHESSFKGREP